MNRRESMIAVVALGAATGRIVSFAQQQGKVWRVGFLSLSSPSEGVQNTAAFREALRELGYIEGRNLVLEWRFAEGSFERLTDQAADLVQYGADVRDLEQQVARYVDRIFKGAQPSDLPVERPTRFELTVNMRTARALQVTIPQALLVRANELIQ